RPTVGGGQTTDAVEQLLAVHHRGLAEAVPFAVLPSVPILTGPNRRRDYRLRPRPAELDQRAGSVLGLEQPRSGSPDAPSDLGRGLEVVGDVDHPIPAVRLGLAGSALDHLGRRQVAVGIGQGAGVVQVYAHQVVRKSAGLDADGVA